MMKKNFSGDSHKTTQFPGKKGGSPIPPMQNRRNVRPGMRPMQKGGGK